MSTSETAPTAAETPQNAATRDANSGAPASAPPPDEDTNQRGAAPQQQPPSTRRVTIGGTNAAPGSPTKQQQQEGDAAAEASQPGAAPSGAAGGQQQQQQEAPPLPNNPGPTPPGAPSMMQQQPMGSMAGVDPFVQRRGSMASFGMDDFFGRRPSLGFDMGMDAFFGRRDSMDSTAVALDAALMDLSRRRYSSAMGSLPSPDAMSYGAPPPVSSASQASGSQASHESITARQQQLQQQQRELEQRQKELEFQRQQLIASMQERSYGAAPIMDRMGGGSLGLGSVGSQGSFPPPPPPPPQQQQELQRPGAGGTGPQQQWWICQICNSKAFSSHEEASAHEATCQGDNSSRGIKSGGGGGGMSDNTSYALPMTQDAMMMGGPGRNFSMGLGGMLDTSGRGMSMGLGTMDNSARGVVSMGMDSSRGGSVGFDSSRNMSLGMDSSMSSYHNERTMSMGPFAMLQTPLPLAMESDKDWLTPLHCFVRRHCVEVFTASESDVATPSKGKRKPIQVGQVGIRCPHCRTLDAEGDDKSRERGSVYYPTTISSIYNATMNLLQRHLHNCPAVPDDIMRQYETLKADDARSGTSKRYWIESALSLGLVDTPNGIRHSALRPPPLPSLTHQQESTGQSASRRDSNEFFSTKSNAMQEMKEAGVAGAAGEQGGRNEAAKAGGSVNELAPKSGLEMADSAPLVTMADKPYATTFSYHLLSQMQPCVFTEADRLGKRKGLPPGFPGLACRHCFGGYGSGRFFPSSIKTLSDTSKTLNVLHNHMMRCRKCPSEVKESLERLRTTHDEERAKMKFGSQKAFFARIWERLHGKDMPGSFRRNLAPKKRPQQQQQNTMMPAQYHVQQQQPYQQYPPYDMQQPQQQPMPDRGSLDVLAAASSPSKRAKLE